MAAQALSRSREWKIARVRRRLRARGEEKAFFAKRNGVKKSPYAIDTKRLVNRWMANKERIKMRSFTHEIDG
jgi:hypothetical protein